MKKLRDLISHFFMGYSNFKGRCARPKFWAIAPVYILAFIGVTLVSVKMTGAARQFIFWGFSAVTIVPFLSLIVKRLHDFSITGFAAIALLPILFFGGIWLFLLAVIGIGLVPASRGTNKYGDDARGGNISVFD